MKALKLNRHESDKENPTLAALYIFAYQPLEVTRRRNSSCTNNKQRQKPYEC